MLRREDVGFVHEDVERIAVLAEERRQDLAHVADRQGVVDAVRADHAREALGDDRLGQADARAGLWIELEIAVVAADDQDRVAVALAVRARSQPVPRVGRIDRDDDLTLREHLLGHDLGEVTLALALGREDAGRRDDEVGAEHEVVGDTELHAGPSLPVLSTWRSNSRNVA